MKPRVLFVTHRVPWPPDRGDRIRTWNILHHLSRRANVDVACLADEPVTKSTRRRLQSVSGRLAIIPHSGRRRYIQGLLSGAAGRSATEGLFRNHALLDVLRQWSRKTRWQGVLASSSGVAQYIQPDVIPDAKRRWVDLIDVDSQKWLDYQRRSRWPVFALYGWEGRRLRQLECQLAEASDRLLVVSEAERDLFRSFCSAGDIQAVSNGVDTDYFHPDEARRPEPHSCVFVGVMNYLPNVDAVTWFAEAVWPEVRALYPDAVFRIVGKSPSADVEALAGRDGIEVTGPVDDVRPYLHRSSCAVIPLRIARGVQNKVLEAMACGRPIVCSSEPLKGIPAEPGVHLLQADSKQDWVDRLKHLFSDPSFGDELGLAASTMVRQHYRWETCLNALDDLTGVQDIHRMPFREALA